MKKFIVINEGFTCKNCGKQNSPQRGSCRNHCTDCLYSLHVDEKSPGDRQSSCRALMKPIKITQNSKKGWIIIHKCLKCGKEITNKTAPDDNFDKIIELTQKTNESAGK